MLGLYELYSRLTTRFPAILFESCASGGARFDAGLLAWAPQAWTSDDTDAVERLAIQWGTSIPYPLSSMGAHVSAVPNHQTGRVTPIGFRAAVAMFGAFGYELDPTALSDDEKAEVRRQVAFYVERRDLFQRGRFLRLRSPFEGDGNETAWMVRRRGGDRAVVGFYRVLARPAAAAQPARRCAGSTRRRPTRSRPGRRSTAPDGSFVRGGDELMRLGLRLEPPDPLPGPRSVPGRDRGSSAATSSSACSTCGGSSALQATRAGAGRGLDLEDARRQAGPRRVVAQDRLAERRHRVAADQVDRAAAEARRP